MSGFLMKTRSSRNRIFAANRLATEFCQHIQLILYCPLWGGFTQKQQCYCVTAADSVVKILRNISGTLLEGKVPKVVNRP